MDAIGKKKEVFPQTLKGLCIIFVVLIHLPWGQGGEWTVWMWIGIRKIINFAVATFFFLSAYYTKPYAAIVGNGICSYYKTRLSRILIPYVFWASVYIFCIPILMTGHIDYRWAFLFLTGKGPTYFLLALAQFTLLNPILQKYKNNPILNILFWSVTPLYIIFYYTYNFVYGIEFKPEQFFCFPWFACYYLGLKIQDAGFRNRIRSKPSIVGMFLCAVVLMLSMYEAGYIYYRLRILSFAISQITIGSILYSLAIILLFNMIWDDKGSDVRNKFTSLGDYSMGIFLMHPLFNWIFKYIFIHAPGGADLYTTNLGFMFIHIAILIMSVTVSYFTSRFLSIRFPKITKPLGLK